MHIRENKTSVSNACECTYFLLAVVGNIGAGKSTFLNRVRSVVEGDEGFAVDSTVFHAVQLAQEDVDQWKLVKDLDGKVHDLLAMYYRNQKDEAVRFQTNMLNKRLEQQRAMDSIMKSACPSERGEPCPRRRYLRIAERSVKCGLVFADVLHRDGNLSALDYAMFQGTVENFDQIAHHPDAVVFLDVSATECNTRMRARNRDAETGVPLEYLESLDAAYRSRFPPDCVTYMKNPTGSDKTEEGREAVRTLLHAIGRFATA